MDKAKDCGVKPGMVSVDAGKANMAYKPKANGEAMPKKEINPFVNAGNGKKK